MTPTADIVFTAFVSYDTAASKHSFCFVWVALISLKIYGSSFIADRLSDFRRLGNVKSASLENIRRGFAAEWLLISLRNALPKSLSFCSPTPGMRRNSVEFVG